MGYEELIREIRSEVGDAYVDDANWPKAYRGAEPRAIILGTDPGNRRKDRVMKFEFVFGLESSSSPYFRMIKHNLGYLKLEMDDLYVQNVCRNYFDCDTSRNKKWQKIANLWLPYLKKELDDEVFVNVPVLITAKDILTLIVPKEHQEKACKTYYETHEFIKPEDNYLGRIVIPFFRHYYYDLSKWPDYVQAVRRALGIGRGRNARLYSF